MEQWKCVNLQNDGLNYLGVVEGLGTLGLGKGSDGWKWFGSLNLERIEASGSELPLLTMLSSMRLPLFQISMVVLPLASVNTT